MSITVVCPNGHSLKVKAELAGRTGRCPVCKAVVKVPKPPAEKLSEDAILSILSTPDPNKKPSEVPDSTPPAGARHDAKPPKKVCPRCNRDVSTVTHICPHCRTYIAGLSDFEHGVNQ